MAVLALQKDSEIWQVDDEQWRPVVGYEGLYEVSSYGAVRSLCRKTLRRLRNGGVRAYTIPARVLSICTSDSSRATVHLHQDNQGSTLKVHSLVVAAFIGPCPEGMEVCHNDGNAHNNRLSNLRYDTHAGNLKDALDQGTFQVGARHYRTKFTENDIREIMRLAKCMSQNAIAERYQCRQETISRILSRSRWKHLPRPS